ncbi:hypothetical protein ERO13_D09G100333v2 [Gossypium hirsutum]|uniref:Uncharacterized protein n=4 Tax=Gossypium TaxID=3633 RepID=A0A0D2S1J0_GOSRA|nr:hypothetical protein ES319_D09G113700v1 [Gossypium barbadense]KAG4129746.1 hypothetical protein ERO13_D09G100333v2 [Gossypium hirsutum]KJB35501.1 hypothetical protein B456_006G117600 [Gossypium raimondii]TYH53770.1 hypothetical protein ES332_D09G123800v1 [Gossypium tomentosum]TYI64872.1 hypothetical protein E1A91_D09G118900v1 [Gossypium mustelinum]
MACFLPSTSMNFFKGFSKFIWIHGGQTSRPPSSFIMKLSILNKLPMALLNFWSTSTSKYSMDKRKLVKLEN